MRVFEKGVKLLESVHQLGIVHGDIHAGNIALRDFELSTMVQLEKLISGRDIPADWLVLIDFGKARFIPEIRKEGVSGDLNLDMLSPRHLKGGPIGCRDDIFRLFELVLNSATDNKLADYYSKQILSAPKLGKLKLTEDLVVKSGIPTTDSSWEVLREILGLVKGDGTVVKYKELIEKAQTLIEQLSLIPQS